MAPAEKGVVLSLQQDLQTRMHDVSASTSEAPTSKRIASSSRAADRRQEEEAQEGSGSESDSELKDADKRTARRENSLKSWNELTDRQKHAELVKATKKYCQRAHKKTKILRVRVRGPVFHV